MKFVSFILISLVFVTCKNKPQQDEMSLGVFDLTNFSESDILKLSDLNIEDVNYIPLETNDSSLFNNIGKIIVSDSIIYIKDYQSTILRFGNDGSFKNRINRKGRGPKEYNDAYDFVVDPDLHDIYICSITDKKIYSYTNQGKFLNYFTMPQGTLTIEIANGNILCHRPYLGGNEESHLVMLDKKGKEIEEFPKYKYNTELNFKYGYIKEIVWFRFNDNLYIKDIHSDTVFLFNRKQFIPQYVLDHRGKTITPEARSQFNTEEEFLTLGAKYSVEINVLRFGNYILSEFMYDNKLFIYAGEMSGNKEHFGNLKRGIVNDIDGGPSLWYNSIYYYNDSTILFWVDAYALISHVKSEDFRNSTPKFPERKKALEQLVNSLNENDNPVLMLIKLKD